MGMGKKQVEQLSAFSTSLVGWGMGAFVTMIYFTDWKVITTYIPFYNGKYAKPQAAPPPCD